MEREYRIKVSGILGRRIQRASKILGVSQKNLLIFLMCNTYDKMCEKTEQEQCEIINEALDKYNKEKKTAEDAAKIYRKKTKSQESGISGLENQTKRLDFRVNDFIDDIIQELAKKNHKTKSEIVIACVYDSLDVIDYILNGYQGMLQIIENKKDYSYSKDKSNILSYTGISKKDFSRLSEAFVLCQLLENTSIRIRRRIDFFDEK